MIVVSYILLISVGMFCRPVGANYWTPNQSLWKVLMHLIFTDSQTLLNLQEEDKFCMSGLYTKLLERIGCEDVGEKQNPDCRHFKLWKSLFIKAGCCWARQSRRHLSVHMGSCSFRQKAKMRKVLSHCDNSQVLISVGTESYKGYKDCKVCYSFMSFLKYFIVSKLQIF